MIPMGCQLVTKWRRAKSLDSISLLLLDIIVLLCAPRHSLAIELAIAERVWIPASLTMVDEQCNGVNREKERGASC